MFVRSQMSMSLADTLSHRCASTFESISRDMCWRFSVRKELASRLHNQTLIYDSLPRTSTGNPLKPGYHQR
jgi:hypothetical protein